jgi:hypothetical protein
MSVLRNFFYFSKSEKRAVIALAVVLLLVLAGMVSYRLYRSAGDTSFVMSALHDFDPNTVDSLTLDSFGVEGAKIMSLYAYRAGHRIVSADDMLHVDGWTESDVRWLTPFVKVKHKAAKKNSRKKRRRT